MSISFSQAMAIVAEHHPAWHIWHSETVVWATAPISVAGGSGTTLDAPTPERMDQVIAEWEHFYGAVAA